MVGVRTGRGSCDRCVQVEGATDDTHTYTLLGARMLSGPNRAVRTRRKRTGLPADRWLQRSCIRSDTELSSSSSISRSV